MKMLIALLMLVSLWHITIDLDYISQIAELEHQLEAQTKKVEELEPKVERYEYIISDFMMGTWTPEMGILKEFEEEWYGHPIWTFKAVNRSPGSPAIDIGEIIDRESD